MKSDEYQANKIFFKKAKHVKGWYKQPVSVKGVVYQVGDTERSCVALRQVWRQQIHKENSTIKIDLYDGFWTCDKLSLH